MVYLPRRQLGLSTTLKSHQVPHDSCRQHQATRYSMQCLRLRACFIADHTCLGPAVYHLTPSGNC